MFLPYTMMLTSLQLQTENGRSTARIPSASLHLLWKFFECLLSTSFLISGDLERNFVTQDFLSLLCHAVLSRQLLCSWTCLPHSTGSCKLFQIRSLVLVVNRYPIEISQLIYPLHSSVCWTSPVRCRNGRTHQRQVFDIPRGRLG